MRQRQSNKGTRSVTAIVPHPVCSPHSRWKMRRRAGCSTVLWPEPASANCVKAVVTDKRAAQQSQQPLCEDKATQ